MSVELQYRIYDRSVQIDGVVGLDLDSTVRRSMESLEKETPPYCFGLYECGTSDLLKTVQEIILDSTLIETLSGKRIMFVRSVNVLETGANIEDEVRESVAAFIELKKAFGGNILFFFTTDIIIRPMVPEGMFYAWTKVVDTDGPNMFKRVVMSRISQIFLEQKEGSALYVTKGRKISAETIHVADGQPVPIVYGSENIYSITRHDVCFEMFSNFKKESKILVVFGQSALDQGKVELPVFRRWSWGRDIPHSSLVINDPTLYLGEELLAGWFVGDSKNHYAETTALIIKDMAKEMEISNENIIFLGASAGGLTSLIMASFIPCSSAVVDIAQTDVTRYFYKNYMNTLYRVALDETDLDVVFSKYKARLKAVESFRINRCVPNMVISQNTHDMTAGEITTQFGEFIRGTMEVMAENPSTRESKMIIMTNNRNHLLKGGHFPLSKEKTLELLQIGISNFCPAAKRSLTCGGPNA
ncbi:MAG: hypothetical protein QG588_149 [Candidatus Poribacteria bacterium]|nr:hypothetical protein [Candidatus Poribacteria bacterium]